MIFCTNESNNFLFYEKVEICREFGFGDIHSMSSIKEFFRKDVKSRNWNSLAKINEIIERWLTNFIQSLMVSGGIPIWTAPAFLVLMITPPRSSKIFDWFSTIYVGIPICRFRTKTKLETTFVKSSYGLLSEVVVFRLPTNSKSSSEHKWLPCSLNMNSIYQ